MKKFIAILVIIVLAVVAVQYFDLGPYIKAYSDKTDYNVKVIIPESGLDKELSNSRKNVLRFILTEKLEYTEDGKPAAFDKSDLSGEIVYSITIDGQEYLYKPKLNCALKQAKYEKDIKHTICEGTDKFFMKFILP